MFQLLAEGGFDIPAQAIVFILVAIFSFLKWLFEKLAARNEEKSREEQLDGLYEMYRDEIRERQTQVATPPEIPQQAVPPVIPQQVQPVQQTVQTPPPTPELVTFTPRYSQEDIQRARASKKQPSAYSVDAINKEKRKRSMDRKKLIYQLKNKSSLRQALIVREILGPPKGLES